MRFFKNYKPVPFVRMAFSVIEIIIVITIIGILVAVSLPRMDTFYIIKFQGALRKLISDVRYTQSQAVSRHANTRIVFNPALNNYQASLCAAGCGVEDNWTALTDPFTRGDLIVDYNGDSQYQGIDITSADFAATQTLRFDWQGQPQDNSGDNLTANGTVNMSYHGETAALDVVARTGKVEVNASF